MPYQLTARKIIPLPPSIYSMGYKLLLTISTPFADKTDFKWFKIDSKASPS